MLNQIYIQQNNQNQIFILEELNYKRYLADPKITNYFTKYKNIIDINIIKDEFGTFTIRINNISFVERQVILSINNKINIVMDREKNPYLTPIILKPIDLQEIQFKSVYTISIAVNVYLQDSYLVRPLSEKNKWIRLCELDIKFFKKQQTNKIFYLHDDGLFINQYSTFHFNLSNFGITLNTEISEFKILPKKLLIGTHNINLLEIIKVSNILIPIIFGKSVEGLIISTKKQNIKFDQTNISPKDHLRGVIGNIIFDENTYYSFKDNNTNIGIGENSQKGYLIPYKYYGTIFPIITLDFGFEENFIVGYENYIKEPYFDKNIGKIKLTISESDEFFDDTNKNFITIKNSEFIDIILGNYEGKWWNSKKVY